MKKEYCGYYNNDDYRIEYKGAEYSVVVSAYGEGWYTPAVPYLRNGDPGYPADGDWDIKEIDITQIKVWDEDKEDWAVVNDYSDEYKDLVKAFKDWVIDNLEEDDFDIRDYVPEHEEED